MNLDIVSAQESIFSGVIESAVFPGEAGELGVLPGHAPLLARLKAGAVRIHVLNKIEPEKFFISGGLLEVLPDRITVLADVAVKARDLDEMRAIEIMKRAETVLIHANARHDFAAAEAELAAVSVALLNIRGKR